MVSHKFPATIPIWYQYHKTEGQEQCKINRSYVEKIQYCNFKVKRTHVHVVLCQGFVAVSVFLKQILDLIDLGFIQSKVA